MLQSSFISSSDARRYFLTVTIVVIVAVAAVCVFNWFGISHGFADWRDLRLQRYQLAKLDTLQHADVVLIGDVHSRMRSIPVPGVKKREKKWYPYR